MCYNNEIKKKSFWNEFVILFLGINSLMKLRANTNREEIVEKLGQ